MVKMTFNNEKQTAFKKNPEGIFENSSWGMFLLLYCSVVEIIYVCHLHA